MFLLVVIFGLCTLKGGSTDLQRYLLLQQCEFLVSSSLHYGVL